MTPYENNASDLFLMNEKGEYVKIMRFAEMQTAEVKMDPRIDLKELYLQQNQSEREGTFELTPESAAQLTELQKQFDAEVIENLQQQIKAVDAVIAGLKSCDVDSGCSDKYTYYEKLYEDAIAIAEAYKKVVKSGLQMMENRK